MQSQNAPLLLVDRPDLSASVYEQSFCTGSDVYLKDSGVHCLHHVL